MPRDGSNVYHRPSGTDGIPNTPVQSAPYNTYTADIEQDLNLPRPIVAGGTAATNADVALLNLSAEKAKQVVTNWDSMVWLAGSFYAATTASGTSPVAAHAFAGVVYYANATDFVLQAVDLTDTNHPQFIRVMSGGVWGAWAADDASVYVRKAGDTMTGDLTLNYVAPAINLIKAAGNNVMGFVAKVGATPRWLMALGENTAESGANAGSDFLLEAFTDAGVVVAPPAITIKRALNRLLLAGDPVAALDAATKQYTDAGDATVAASAAAKVAKAGDTMTGLLTLSADPVALLGAVPKQYADVRAATCGYFLFLSATSVQFQVYNGNVIKIAGVVSQFPVAFNAANTGVFVNGVAGQNLAASTLYYVYVFNNSGTLTIDFSTTAYAVSTGLTGNVGTYIKAGDETRTLIGMVFTNASSQFVAENVVSWFNKKARQVAATGAATSGAAVAQVEFCTWADEAISFSLNSKATNGTVQGAMGTQLVLDTVLTGIQVRNDVPGAASVSSVAISGTKLLAAGRHTIAQSIGTSGTPSAPVQETYVLFRG